MTPRESILALKERMARSIVGQGLATLNPHAVE